MLSGTELDTSIYNLDFLGADYAVISSISVAQFSDGDSTTIGRVGPAADAGGQFQFLAAPITPPTTSVDRGARPTFRDPLAGVPMLLDQSSRGLNGLPDTFSPALTPKVVISPVLHVDLSGLDRDRLITIGRRSSISENLVSSTFDFSSDNSPATSVADALGQDLTISNHGVSDGSIGPGVLGHSLPDNPSVAAHANGALSSASLIGSIASAPPSILLNDSMLDFVRIDRLDDAAGRSVASSNSTADGDVGGMIDLTGDGGPTDSGYAGSPSVPTVSEIFDGSTDAPQEWTIVAPGEDVGVHVADTSVDDASAAAEGGAIAIERLVAALRNTPGTVVGDAEELVADADAVTSDGAVELNAVDEFEPAGGEITGELARAVAFELIDGEAVPMARSSDGPEQAGRGERNDAAAKAAHPLSLLAGPAGAVPLAAYLGSMVDGLANPLAAIESADGRASIDSAEAALDAVHGEVFSRWGRGDAETEPVVRGDHRRPWLDATPLLVMLALERFVARRSRDRDQELAGRNKPIRKGGAPPTTGGVTPGCNG